MSKGRSRLEASRANPTLGLAAGLVFIASVAVGQTPTPAPNENGPTLDRAAAEIRALPALGTTGATDPSASLKFDTPTFGAGGGDPVAPPRQTKTPAKGPVWVQAPEPSPRPGRGAHADRSLGRNGEEANALSSRPGPLGQTGPAPIAGSGSKDLEAASLNPLAPFMQQWVGAHDRQVLEQAGVLPSAKNSGTAGALGAINRPAPGAGGALPAANPGRAPGGGDPRATFSASADAQQRARNPYLASVQPGLDALARLPSPRPLTGPAPNPGMAPVAAGQPLPMVAPTSTPTPPPVIYVPPAADDAKYFKQLKKF